MPAFQLFSSASQSCATTDTAYRHLQFIPVNLGAATDLTTETRESRSETCHATCSTQLCAHRQQLQRWRKGEDIHATTKTPHFKEILFVHLSVIRSWKKSVVYLYCWVNDSISVLLQISLPQNRGLVWHHTALAACIQKQIRHWAKTHSPSTSVW